MYQQNKSSASKLKFRQACHHCKSVWSSQNVYANETKEAIFSQKSGSCYFWQIANSGRSKGNSTAPSPFNGTERYGLLLLINQKCFQKTFLKTQILMTQVSHYLFFLLQIIWNCLMLVPSWFRRSWPTLIVKGFWSKCESELLYASWTLQYMIPVFRNIRGRSRAKSHHPVFLWLEKSLKNLKIMGLLIFSKNVALCTISSMVTGLLNQLQIFWQFYLIKLLGLF